MRGFFQKQFRFTPCFSPISERTPRTAERRFYHAKTIQHAAPQPGSQDTHDRGRIRRVCGKAFCLQHEPSRVYPASHNRGSHAKLLLPLSLTELHILKEYGTSDQLETCMALKLLVDRCQISNPYAAINARVAIERLSPKQYLRFFASLEFNSTNLR